MPRPVLVAMSVNIAMVEFTKNACRLMRILMMDSITLPMSNLLGALLASTMTMVGGLVQRREGNPGQRLLPAVRSIPSALPKRQLLVIVQRRPIPLGTSPEPRNGDGKLTRNMRMFMSTRMPRVMIRSPRESTCDRQNRGERVRTSGRIPLLTSPEVAVLILRPNRDDSRLRWWRKKTRRIRISMRPSTTNCTPPLATISCAPRATRPSRSTPVNVLLARHSDRASTLNPQHRIQPAQAQLPVPNIAVAKACDHLRPGIARTSIWNLRLPIHHHHHHYHGPIMRVSRSPLCPPRPHRQQRKPPRLRLDQFCSPPGRQPQQPHTLVLPRSVIPPISS